MTKGRESEREKSTTAARLDASETVNLSDFFARSTQGKDPLKAQQDASVVTLTARESPRKIRLFLSFVAFNGPGFYSLTRRASSIGNGHGRRKGNRASREIDSCSLHKLSFE